MKTGLKMSVNPVFILFIFLILEFKIMISYTLYNQKIIGHLLNVVQMNDYNFELIFNAFQYFEKLDKLYCCLQKKNQTFIQFS